MIPSPGQWFKHPELPWLWCGLQLQLRFYPWPGNFHIRGHGAKKEEKKNQELRDCFYRVYFFRFHQEVRSCNFFLSAFAERDFWLWLLGRALEGKMFSECEGSRARWIWVQISLLPLLVFCFFRTKPKACRSSQARGPNRAAAAGLHHSHSNTGN